MFQIHLRRNLWHIDKRTMRAPLPCLLSFYTSEGSLSIVGLPFMGVATRHITLCNVVLCNVYACGHVL